MSMRKDPLRIAIRIAVYAVLYFAAAALVFGPVMLWVGGYLFGITAAGLLAALFTNWLSLRIYEDRHILDLGLRWNRSSGGNVALGVAGGILAACLVVAPPLVAGAAHLVPTPASHPSFSAIPYLACVLAIGASGEELLFRGYGFQLLIASIGEWTAVLPVAVVFGLAHGGNPNASWLGVANTVGFGVLFGYAYLRSRDLWLPIGLHFGWNLTLPLFGANVSGLRMNVTGHEIAWTAGKLWSGGDYGPEASVLTSGVLVLLILYVWKAPVRRQFSPLTDPPAENAVCEPSPSLPS